MGTWITKPEWHPMGLHFFLRCYYQFLSSFIFNWIGFEDTHLEPWWPPSLCSRWLCFRFGCVICNVTWCPPIIELNTTQRVPFTLFHLPPRYHTKQLLHFCPPHTTQRELFQHLILLPPFLSSPSLHSFHSNLWGGWIHFNHLPTLKKSPHNLKNFSTWREETNIPTMKARGRNQTGEHVIFKATYSGVPVYEFMCRK